MRALVYWKVNQNHTLWAKNDIFRKAYPVNTFIRHCNILMILFLLLDYVSMFYMHSIMFFEWITINLAIHIHRVQELSKLLCQYWCLDHKTTTKIFHTFRLFWEINFCIFEILEQQSSAYMYEYLHAIYVLMLKVKVFYNNT